MSKTRPALSLFYSNRCTAVCRTLIAGAALLFISACAVTPTTEPLPTLSGNYVLDPAHARVNWSLSHAGLSHYTARFDDVSGTLNFDPAQPDMSQADIRIDVASLSTGLPDFDKTLITETKYFDGNTHPEIRFVTTSVTALTDTTGILIGDLTFRGVTRPLTLQTTYNGAGKSFGHAGKTLGFSATGTFLRSEFGMDTLLNFGIGDEITLRIEAEFNEAQ